MRATLAHWQAEDGIAADEGLPDPPLLDLEVEAASSEMRILRHLSAAEGDAAEARRESCAVARRLFDACRANMERFEEPAAALDAAHGGREGSGSLSGSHALQVRVPCMLSRACSMHAVHSYRCFAGPLRRNLFEGADSAARHGGALAQQSFVLTLAPLHGLLAAEPLTMLQGALACTSGAVPRSERDVLDVEQATLTPVLVDTLSALRTIPQESFKQHLKDLFPVLTRLIRCRSASVEMQVALSDLFATKVGPLM